MCKLLVLCSATLTQMDPNAMVAACYTLPVLVSVLTVRFFYVLWACGTVTNQHQNHAPPDCVVSSSLAPVSTYCSLVLPVKYLMDKF
jgi:hypothetical protein